MKIVFCQLESTKYQDQLKSSSFQVRNFISVFFFFFFFSMSFCSMSEYPVSTFVRSVINPSINSFGMTFSIHRRFEFPCRHIYVPDGIPFFYYLSGFRAFTHYMSILSAMRVLCSSLASLPFFFLFLELLFLPWMSY